MKASEMKNASTSDMLWTRLRCAGALALVALMAACGGSSDPVSAAAETHTVSGTVSGLRQSSLGLKVQISSGETFTFLADGTFAFPAALLVGTSYGVTIVTQPTKPDQTCVVNNGNGTVGNADITNIAIVCPYAATHTIGGTVTGLVAGSTVGLLYYGDNIGAFVPLDVAANGPFSFPDVRTSATSGVFWNVVVAAQPVNPNQSCVMTNNYGQLAGADVTDVSVVCGPPTSTHTVRFTITGLRENDGNFGFLQLKNNGGDEMAFRGDGSYQFATALASGSTYNVTISQQPSFPAQTCVVQNGTGTIASVNITDVVVNCPFGTTYPIGGTVSGLLGTQLILQHNASNSLSDTLVDVNSNGAFAFDATRTSDLSGTQYVVKVLVQPTNPAQNCTITSGATGTVGTGPVTDVVVSCGPPLCVPPTGAGTRHGSISAAESWTYAASPHIIPFDVNIGAAVTIEACAVVQMAANSTMTITPAGSLIANGTAGRPVTFQPLVAGAPWATIRAMGGVLSMSHAVITGGGAPQATPVAYWGALRMQPPGSTGTLHLDDVEIAGSMSQGVYILGNVGFDATSQNLRVHDSVGYPVHVYARVVGSVPSGTYTGNGHDAIAIAGAGGPVVDAQTMHDRGVPYHVGSGADGGRMDVAAPVGSVAVLTIEPNVTIQFPPGGGLVVDASGSALTVARGALIAIGGATQPVVFTSDQGAASAAGDWLGIEFGGILDPRNLMQQVRVEFAGGATVSGSNSCPYPGRVGPNYAAVRIYGAPSSEFITNSEIFASGRDGIDRGWRSDTQPDFLSGNTFTAVAACKETTPRTAAGVCPPNPPCP
ncbi:MAG: hypothetical protein ABJA61_04185 [Caldimonas sp.]